MTLRALLLKIGSEQILFRLEDTFYSDSRKAFKDDLYHWYEYLIRKLSSIKFKESKELKIAVEQVYEAVEITHGHDFIFPINYKKDYRVSINFNRSLFYKEGIIMEDPTCEAKACWYCPYKTEKLAKKTEWKDLAPIPVESTLSEDLAAACILHEIGSLGFKDGKITI